jgi:hypothetical protein
VANLPILAMAVKDDAYDCPKPLKKRRMIVEVVVPTLETVYGRRASTLKIRPTKNAKVNQTQETRREADAIFNSFISIYQSRAEVESIPKLQLGSIYRRIDAIGHEQYPVTLLQYIQNAAARRDFFSRLFGGNRT